MVGVLVEEPDRRVVGVGHRVGRDEPLPVTLTPSDEPGHGGRGPEVELEPLVF